MMSKILLILGFWLAGSYLVMAQNGVGVGLTTPTQALDVDGGVLLRGYRAVSHAGAYLQWNRTGEGETWLLNQQGSGPDSTGLRFGGVTTSDAVTEYGRFLANGNLGLGTTAPKQRLDVRGVGRFMADGPVLQLLGKEQYSAAFVEFYPNGPNTQRSAYFGFSNAYSPDFIVANDDQSGSLALLTNNNVYFSAGGSNRLVVQGSDGHVGVGNPTPAYPLDVVGDIYATGFVRSAGTIINSDQRLKQNIRPLSGALATVLALRGVRYTWNALGVQHGGQANREQVGVLAQELEKVYPELVTAGADGYKAVNYAQLTPVLLEAIKEQQQQIELLRTQAAEASQRATKAEQTLQADHADLQSLKQQLAKLQGAAEPGLQARH